LDKDRPGLWFDRKIVMIGGINNGCAPCDEEAGLFAWQPWPQDGGFWPFSLNVDLAIERWREILNSLGMSSIFGLQNQEMGINVKK
jgi:hypothetical protein